ncbi:tetratricopeptide repeat protein [Flavicella sediminum]|uniref:tetratricopeptide repeat protein n=1 Tax=Flavicella sediminum TaxID=2585141 RepID=UPI001122C31E|nr:tetratricopeptide repeat protein [Flavicella sediminum]
MKKVLLLMTCLFFSMNMVNAQDTNQEAAIKYNLFKGDYKSKNYAGAYENWLWCLNNSPKLSVNIYKLGVTIAKDKLAKATPEERPAAIALVRRVFDQRIELYPKDLAKVYSDYADFLSEEKQSDEDVFQMLDKAYKIDPSKMGVKAIYRYFSYVTEKNKDSNVQFIFDTYDVLVEAVHDKLDNYAKKLDGYSAKEEAGNVLTSSEKRYKKAYENNSKAIGQVEGGLDKIIVDLSTCDRLIPMFTADFEANKTNGAWLKSSVSRMYKKECTEDPLYDKLVEAYVKAQPSPEASVFYAGILVKNNQFDKAKEYFEKAVQQEEDTNKKAAYLYKIAQIMQKKGRKVEARSYARKAIANKRSMGKAYLLIASLYAKSANTCGKSEFEKKMVYVAALKMAEIAERVDPANASTAKKYVKSYKSSIPAKKLIFTEGVTSGAPFKIGCWIGETVKIP